MTNYLEVTNLSKSFDSFQLHNISFTLPKGYIMGLIGPNGSGKTTTIKLILNNFFSLKCQLSGTQLFQSLNLLRYFSFSLRFFLLS